MVGLSRQDRLTIRVCATGAERRRKPRIDVDVQAVVRGVDAQGRRFQQSLQVCNLSASGVFMRSEEKLEKFHLGAQLFVVFSFASVCQPSALALAVRGTVRRLEITARGNGVAMTFQDYRCLCASTLNASPTCKRRG